MGAFYRGDGFTVIEVIITLTIVGLFVALFFQLFSTGQSQQAATVRLAAANDLAQTNLRKITSRSQAPDCDSTNDLTQNASAAGSNITYTEESDANLPPVLPPKTQPGGTQQSLKVVYPQGCELSMPAKIVSTVTYGQGPNTETIRRVSYVNIGL